MYFIARADGLFYSRTPRIKFSILGALQVLRRRGGGPVRLPRPGLLHRRGRARAAVRRLRGDAEPHGNAQQRERAPAERRRAGRRLRRLVAAPGRGELGRRPDLGCRTYNVGRVTSFDAYISSSAPRNCITSVPYSFYKTLASIVVSRV